MDPGKENPRSGGAKTGKARARPRRVAKRQGTGNELPAAAGDESPSQLRTYVAFSEHSKLVSVLLIILFAVVVHSRVVPLVSDVDSFYHLRHAWVYRTNGLFDSAFPWTQFSVVKTYAADIWYGFHLLIIPLTFLNPLLSGLYWGGFLVTVVSLWLVFLTFRRLAVRWPLFWVFFVALICPDLLYRLTMLRPHPLSLGLNLLLFAYLVTEPSRRSLAAIVVIAAALAWFHLALSWLPVVIAGVVSLTRLLHRQMPEWRTLGAVCLGLVLGVFLRPNPIGALHLAYIQVVELMQVKQAGVALGFGIELWPFYWGSFVELFAPVTILLLLAVGTLCALIRNRRFSAIDLHSRIAIWASLTIAILFLVLTFAVARRSHEVFFGFSAIFLSLVFQQWRPATQASLGANLLIPTALLALVGAPLTMSRFDAIMVDAFDPGKFQAVGEWLAQHARPGEIVFNVHWDRFGELFFWNPQNYYINGMDPIFEYAYDPHLCWKNRFYELDAADEYTCGDYPCTDDQMIGTSESLKNDFHASYIVLEKDRNPNLNRYLSTAAQFTNVLESESQVALYRID